MRASCVICTDLFDGISVILTATCGHVFHENCIYQWLECSHTCPECRKKLTVKSFTKLYFNLTPNEVSTTNCLENKVSELQAKIREKDVDIVKMKQREEELREHVRAAEQRASDLEQEVYRLKSEATSTRLLVKDLKKSATKIGELETANKSLMNKVELFQNVQTVISGTQKDVEDILHSAVSGPEAAKDLATYCSLLKRELLNVSDSKQELRNEIAYLRRSNITLNVNNKKLNGEITQLKEQTLSLEKENSILLARQKRSAPVTEKEKDSATITYESPAPERLKRPNDEEITVTPLSQRVNFNTVKRTKAPCLSYEKNITFKVKPLKKPLTDIQADIKTILASRKSIEQSNENSAVRSGYNGLGGHSKFISQSKRVNFKPPSRRK